MKQQVNDESVFLPLPQGPYKIETKPPFIEDNLVIEWPISYEPAGEYTWVYWTQHDTKEKGVPDEWVWERLRLRRDQILSETDYRMVNDSPWDSAPWAEYRQSLRDLPKKTKDPRLAEWPVAPNE